MRRKPLALLLFVIAAAAGGAWWKFGAGSPAKGGEDTVAAAPGASAPGRGGPQVVGIVSAQQRDVPVSIEASATVSSPNMVELRAQTTNTVREVLVKDGQDVKRGQLLFRFDERADRANLDKARAQLARDRATLADLQRQLARAQDLRAQNFVAQNAVDTAQANVDAAQALLRSDEAAVQAAEVQLSYNEIRSPLNGRAGAVNVFPGSLVQASATATPLVTIAQIHPISVSFALPETQLAPLLRASRDAKQEPLLAEVLLPGSRRGADAEAPPKGRISFVDNSVDASTGTIKVKADFDNQRQLLWPGQYVRVRMTLRTIKDAIVIPQAAIILRGNERSVYIVDADKTAQLKPVQIRYSFGEFAVVEGIAAGAKVVLDGKQNLRPGNPVREQPAAVDPAAAARRAGPASEAAADAANAASATASGAAR